MPQRACRGADTRGLREIEVSKLGPPGYEELLVFRGNRNGTPMTISLSAVTRVVLCCGVLGFGAAHASPLSDAASRLQPGESVRVNTHLPGSVLTPEDANFIMWASSGVWDPVRHEVRFVGKRYSTFPNHFLVYAENSDSWSNNRALPGALTGNGFGHGYDHNTVDPATGTHYFREYNSRTIHVWNGSWSTAPQLPQMSMDVAASISWVPGLGLIYVDQNQFVYLDGGSWKSLGAAPDSNYHAVSEYNPTSQTLIYGGGNGVTAMWKLDVNRRISRIKDPPFGQGASSSQTVLVSDPSSDQFISWQKNSTTWAGYDVGSDTWSTLQKSSGDGSTPQRGVPNLSDNETFGAVIGIPISTYGVIMYIQFLGNSTDAGVWVYKHSPSVAVATPNPPTNVSAE